MLTLNSCLFVSGFKPKTLLMKSPSLKMTKIGTVSSLSLINTNSFTKLLWICTAKTAKTRRNWKQSSINLQKRAIFCNSLRNFRGMIWVFFFWPWGSFELFYHQMSLFVLEDVGAEYYTLDVNIFWVNTDPWLVPLGNLCCVFFCFLAFGHFILGQFYAKFVLGCVLFLFCLQAICN